MAAKQYGYYIKGNTIAIVEKDVAFDNDPNSKDYGPGLEHAQWKSPLSDVSDGIELELSYVQDMEVIDDEEYEKVIETVDRLKKKIKRMRQTGLETGGAFSVENLAFKILRRTNYLAKLNDFKHQAYDKKMSLTF